MSEQVSSATTGDSEIKVLVLAASGEVLLDCYLSAETKLIDLVHQLPVLEGERCWQLTFDSAVCHELIRPLVNFVTHEGSPKLEFTAVAVDHLALAKSAIF